jgi:2-polyprenyl-3-methyl-5-hydroxy-6-metoxy-1,4-benzoquinol methylase
MEERTDLSRQQRFVGKTPEEIFNLVYDTRDWGSEESVSGYGSTMEHTKSSRMRLPGIFKKYEIKRVLDVACGDFNWIKNIAGKTDYYRGTDIVKRLVDSNNKKYGVPGKIEFECGNLIEGINNDGNFDAIIAKDVLVHFPTKDVLKVINNFRKSGIKYIFLSHFPTITKNSDLIIHGQWRPINFTKAPFNLGNPLEIIWERSEIYSWPDENNVRIKRTDKSLSLWRI